MSLFRAPVACCRGHILEGVWGRSPDLNTRTVVDTHVSRIRNKLDLRPGSGWQLKAVSIARLPAGNRSQSRPPVSGPPLPDAGRGVVPDGSPHWRPSIEPAACRGPFR